MRIKILIIVSLLALLAGGAWYLFGRADIARLSVEAVSGAKPNITDPRQQKIPTIKIADVVGWQGSAKPVAATGLSVSQFAADLDHPRWLYELPNGDILVAESNRPETAPEGITDVVVTDPIPVGCNYVAGSATGGGTLIGDAMIFNIASIATRDSVTLTYKLLTDPDNASIATFFNDFENGETGWYPESLDDINFGNFSWIEFHNRNHISFNNSRSIRLVDPGYVCLDDSGCIGSTQAEESRVFHGRRLYPDPSSAGFR